MPKTHVSNTLPIELGTIKSSTKMLARMFCIKSLEFKEKEYVIKFTRQKGVEVITTVTKDFIKATALQEFEKFLKELSGEFRAD